MTIVIVIITKGTSIYHGSDLINLSSVLHQFPI